MRPSTGGISLGFNLRIWLLVFSLFGGFNFARVAVANPDVTEVAGCQGELVGVLESQLALKIKETHWIKRWHFKRKVNRLRPAIEQELARTCPNPDRCTPEEVGTAVAQAIQRAFPQKNSTSNVPMRAYAVFLGTIATNAVMNTVLVHYLPPLTATLLASSLTIVTATLVNALGAPVIEPLAAKVRLWNFSQVNATKLGVRPPLERTFEQVYLGSQQHMSSIAQSGRGIYRNAITPLQQIFSACQMAMLVNPEEARNLVPGMIAQLVVDLRRNYQEVNLKDKLFIDYAHEMYANRYVTKEGFEPLVEQILEKVKRLDLDTDYKPELLNEYRTILYFWLAPRPVAI